MAVHSPAPPRSPWAARQGPAFLRDDIGVRKNNYIFLAAPLPLFVPWKEKVFLLQMLSLSAWIDQQGWEQCVLPLSNQFLSSHDFPHWKRLFPVLLIPGNAWSPRCPSHSHAGALPEALSCQRDHRPPGTSPGSAQQQFQVTWTFPAQDYGMGFCGTGNLFVFHRPISIPHLAVSWAASSS